jgi:hypothetical protein
VLLYDIYKDVRRTRGHVGYFRDPQVQALMIRVLYTYSKTHPAVSYNQVRSCSTSDVPPSRIGC